MYVQDIWEIFFICSKHPAQLLGLICLPETVKINPVIRKRV